MSNQQPQGFQPVESLPENGSRPPWLLGLGALLLVGLGGVLVGALLFGGGGGTPARPSPSAAAQVSPRPTTALPSATAGGPSTLPTASAAPPATGGPSAAPSSPEPSSPDPSPGGSPGASIPPDVAAQIDAVVAQVPALRELEELRPVPYAFISREQFQADLEELLEEEVDPEFLAAEERALKRLGLLPDDLDLRELLLELYGAEVAAYYQPDDGTFYIIERDARFSALDRMIVAHEYTHALQDQHFDLEGTRITDPEQGDAILAQLAVVEGDATLLMTDWAQAHLTMEELFEVLRESLTPGGDDTLENMPPILSRQLVFPYGEGAAFVTAVQQQGGWAAVDAMHRTPPTSTEQVLHPEKFQAGEAPVAIEIPDLAADLGEGWQRTYQQTFGELNVHVWLAADEVPPEAIPGMPVEYPYAEEAAGWGGDRLHMYEGPDDDWAILWHTEWDTAADAQEFADRAAQLQGSLDGVSELEYVTQRPGSTRVTLYIASAQPALERLMSAPR